jgi:O-antigen/teichoic acid export membrane protein
MLFLGVLGVGVSGGLAANLINSAIMIVGSAIPVLARGTPRLDRRLFGHLLRYGVRAQGGSLFQLANARLDLLVLQFFVPLASVGYYAVAQAIAELVLVIGASFQASVMPLVARYTGAPEQDETTIASVRHYGVVGAAAVVANVGFGTLVILFAYGEEFHPALAPMLVLLPGVWFLGLATVIQADLSGRGRPGLASALAGGAAAITVVFDLLLIPPLGVMGAALASVIAYTSLGVGSVVALHRVSGLPIRRLVVPARTDLAAYPRAVRSLATRVLPRRGGTA